MQPARFSGVAIRSPSLLLIERILMLSGQYPGCDLDEIPNVSGDKFVLAVAGVEMAVVLVIGQREEGPPPLAHIVVHIKDAARFSL